MKENFLTRMLKGNEINISRSCFTWNTIAGGVNAAEAIVLLMIVTRTSGVEAAGVLSIAFALGNLLMTIGKFGVRSYQVTDVRKEYSFNVYYTLRICSVFAMVVISAGYIALKIFGGSYSLEKGAVVFCICLIYAIESFEDVFLGYYQEEGRLDIASKVFIIRWVSIISIFFVMIIACNNLLLAIWVALLGSLICDIYLLVLTKRWFNMPKLRIDRSRLYGLVKQCTALFAAAFLTFYVTNAPKYAIDKYLSEDIQAYYGYISMPVFVVELLNCFLYQPHMVDLANEWNSCQYKKFNKRTCKQYIAILFLTVVCAVGAFFLGIPILSYIYGVNLGLYRGELMVLMIAGGALAFVGYTSVLLTIMRKQTVLLYNMLIIAVLALLGFGKITQKFGMMGSTKYYLFLMFILALLNYCCTIVATHRLKRITR
ncbi:MAG: lipopolysaccharide biosynthesis protein [Anaeroplasmataceae bacterium]|jgi:O-antigen/teichoic acid export membrane protein|nr:lipopolysaccharide biosynthesis protein [Anaeroplasmataceae bacterium]